MSNYFKFSPRFSSMLLLLCLQLIIPANGKAQNDSLAFGDKKKINDGLTGQVYFIPAGTQQLPSFDGLKVMGTIYTKKLDIPAQHWTSAFPGIPGRNEWFAIVYTGNFKIHKAGHYTFRLLSDDGAKLFIDKKLVIDNDGIHSASSRLGDINLNASKHSIRLEYFQGLSSEIAALQLFVTFEKETEQVFPGNNFVLSAPGAHNSSWQCWLLYLGIAALVVIILWFWLKTRNKKK